MRVLAAWLLFALCSSVGAAPVGWASEPTDPTVVTYHEASGHLMMGLAGAGVEDVDVAIIQIAVNGTHPELRLHLDYAPESARLAPVPAAIPYAMRVAVYDAASGEFLGRVDYERPGSRTAFIAVGPDDARDLRLELYLVRGMDVDWHLRVDGWRAPIPL